ncbi:MAG: leucine-rich repeat protein [Paludibacteraceae bacterium]
MKRKTPFFLLGLLFLVPHSLRADLIASDGLNYEITGPHTVAVISCIYENKNYFWLTTATIPETVTYNGITYTVTRIEGGAFWKCTTLTSITIPESVTSIGKKAFYGCSSLTKTNYTGDIASWCNIDFDDYTSNPIVYSHNLFVYNWYYAYEKITDLVIPNGVTSIKNYAFDNCYGLTSVIIPESVTSIGKSAFYGCTELTSITIPNSVTWIGDYAFSYCTGLTSITCKAITPSACGDSVFYNISGDVSVHVPCGSLEAYQTADLWSEFTDIQEHIAYTLTVQSSNETMGTARIDSPATCDAPATVSATAAKNYHFVQWSDGNTDNPRTITLTQDTTLTAVFVGYSGKCGDNLYWEYKNNELRITGSGMMYNYTETTQPWLLLADSIYTIYIDNTVASIGEYAFANLGKLSKLHLGAGLETVGANAFAGCLRLGNIYSYAALPPLAEESSFANYNARLYVPCEVLGDYQLAIVFGNFKYIDCISSDGVDVPTNTVTVTPSYEDATFTWPSNGNANAYTLEITKDGVVFCTLTFNANGQLMGIAFAPSKDRNNAHAPQAAQATTNGWQFTVTGLNESSNYAYTMTVTDNGNKVLQTYEGTFTTLGGDLPEGLTQTSEIATGIQKVIRNGQVLILRDGKTYTLTGQEAGE